LAGGSACHTLLPMHQAHQGQNKPPLDIYVATRYSESQHICVT
jgi:hypothetical protein